MCFLGVLNTLSGDHISLEAIQPIKREAHAAILTTRALVPNSLLFRNQTYHSGVAILSWGARAL